MLACPVFAFARAGIALFTIYHTHDWYIVSSGHEKHIPPGRSEEELVPKEAGDLVDW